MQRTDELLLSILESVAAGHDAVPGDVDLLPERFFVTCPDVVFKVSDESLDIATDVEPSGLRETGKPPWPGTDRDFAA